MKDHDKSYENDYEKDQKLAYERPSVVDYGTLVDITRASNLRNSDSPAGIANTAFSVH